MSVKTLYPRTKAAATIVNLTLVYVRAVEPVPTVPGWARAAVEAAGSVDTAYHGVPEQEEGMKCKSGG